MEKRLQDYLYFLRCYPELFDNFEAPFRIITEPSEIEAWEQQSRENQARLGKPIDWTDIGVIYSDPYIFIVKDLVELPDGKRLGYFRLFFQASLKKGEAIAVLPKYKDHLLVLKHFRHTTRNWHYEIPRGFGENNLPAEENARKELIEEMEGEGEALVDLGILHNDTGVESNWVHLFFCDLSAYGQPEKNEGIDEIVKMTIEEFEDAIKEGNITDSFTIAAYARAKLNGLLDP